MKKFYFACILSLSILSCKNEVKSTSNEIHETETTANTSNYTATKTVNNEFETFAGMFLYLESDNAAVLQTGSKMYGVVVNNQMKALNEQCNVYKNKEYDMVPVVVRGVKKPNPVENAWKEIIEIKQIISVQKPKLDDDGTIIIKNNQ